MKNIVYLLTFRIIFDSVKVSKSLNLTKRRRFFFKNILVLVQFENFYSFNINNSDKFVKKIFNVLVNLFTVKVQV